MRKRQMHAAQKFEEQVAAKIGRVVTSQPVNLDNDSIHGMQDAVEEEEDIVVNVSNDDAYKFDPYALSSSSDAC
jgi:hypothetical protein